MKKRPHVEASVQWDSDTGRYRCIIESPDGNAERLCDQPLPLVRWALKWAAARTVSITVDVTVTAGATE